MDCPKCNGTLETRHFGPDVVIRRCSDCHGLWCLAEEMGDLADVPMIDVLDVGDARRGELYNRAAPMEQMNYPRQPHIVVDVCSPCGGMFFDAGELRDARHYTFGDWLKAFRQRYGLI